MDTGRFLELTRVTDESSAMRSALAAALQRNPTYNDSASDEYRRRFRARFADLLRESAAQYSLQVTDSAHLRNISYISDVLAAEYAAILRRRRLRIGTAQKALNLYLKFLWCLDSGRATPPHCPIDRTVLQEAGISGRWTRLDSCEQYMLWISRLRRVAEALGHSGPGALQHWELAYWNKKYGGAEPV